MVFSGCDGGGQATIGTVISETHSGNAYDAVTPNRETYRNAGSATDGLTRAQSFTAKPTTLKGIVHAECTDPSSNQLDGDQASAASFNQVNSKFIITKQGDLTFDIDIKVYGEEIEHGDSLMITVQANILTKTGAGIREGGITNSSLVIRPNPQGNDTVFITEFHNQSGMYKREKVTADGQGDFDHTIKAKINGHKNLAPDDYQLELALRMQAYAQASFGQNNKRFKAKVDSVVCSISLQ
jgi:hypothetical protein